MKVKPTKVPLPTPDEAGKFTKEQINDYLNAVREADAAEYSEELKRATDAKKDEIAQLQLDKEEIGRKLTKAESDLIAARAPAGNADISKVVDEATTAVRNQLQEEYDKKAAELQNRLQSLEEKDKAAQTKELRNRLIQEAGGEGEVLMSLITGDDEETIRKQIEFSKAEVT